MAGVVEDHIGSARELLDAGRTEFEKAQQERGGAAVVALRNSCGKGWLAALEAANAFFLKSGVPAQDLPNTDRGRRYFVRRFMDRQMGRAFVSLRQTFHVDGYYEGIVEFDDMPGYFEKLEEFIEQAEAVEGAEPPEE